MKIKKLLEKTSEHVILIADNDRSSSAAVAKHFREIGYTTVIADGHSNLVQACEKHKPHIIITDTQIVASDVLQSLQKNSVNGTIAPFIITTVDSINEIETIAETNRKRIHDFIIKPISLDELHKKVQSVVAPSSTDSSDPALPELSDIHKAANAITGSDNVDDILESTLSACVGLVDAESGYIELVNKGKNQLVLIRSTGIGEVGAPVSDENAICWTAGKWVLDHKRSLLIIDRDEYPHICSCHKDACSVISLPLKVAEEIIGVVTLNRTKLKPPFRAVDVKMLEILSVSAASAIRNANRYDSVSRKLEELSLISAYSEKLIGLVDKKDIIRCLFETIRNHFPFDMIGFILIKRRFHQFLYWSKKKVPNEKLIEITADVVSRYNQQTDQKLMVKRVSPRMFMAPEDAGRQLDGLFLFSEIRPVVWEDYNFGGAFFAAHDDIENKNDTQSLLSSLINQTRIALTNARLYNDMKENYIRTIKALAIAVDAKDTYTHGHSENVMNIAESIARELSGDEKWIGTIRDAGLLHDIGKIGIPGYILNKPGPLTYEEFNGIMKTHTTLGANIVRDVPFLQDLYSLILYHHEHYDGSGYPEGLQGENIPLGARILHVSDAFEAMTSNRPYRNSLGKKEAFKRLREQKGKQFDPKIVELFEGIARKKGWLEE
ncbi:MAG: HD domain-containing phosphohydrolase [Fibrobacterota bacterium]